MVDKLVPSEPRPKKPERMSTTDLINTPRMRTLYIERFDDIVVDVSDYFNFFDGNCLDAAFQEDNETQLKFEHPIDGKTLVGVLDKVLFDPTIIVDMKRCKVGQLHYEDSLKSWEKQLNVYSYLWNIYRKERVSGVANSMHYKDWSPTQISRSADYPKIAWNWLEQPHWTFEDQERYIKEQLEYHSNKPYDCPEEERWGTFAVRTEGQKRANRVLKTRQECQDWMDETGKGDYIEDRVGLRCKYFCGVRSVCPNSPCCIEKYRGEKL